MQNAHKNHLQGKVNNLEKQNPIMVSLTNSTEDLA